MAKARFPLKGYWRETRRPIYSAALALPFFLVYHAGTLLLHTTYINGADALIIRLLQPLSVNTMFASALLLLACFLAWQFKSGGKWTIDTLKLMAMNGESLVLAVLLLYGTGWLASHIRLAIGGAAVRPGRLAALALYCGAGIYEELVFRAFLLGGLLLVLTRVFRADKRTAAVSAAVATSLLFALFHYVGPEGDPFTLGSFLYRTLGGLYFSALYLIRGFGVTAACHAYYDIIAGLVLSS